MSSATAQFGNVQLDVPIGAWELSLYTPIVVSATQTVPTLGGVTGAVALSKSLTDYDDDELATLVGVAGAPNSSNRLYVEMPVLLKKRILADAKTTFYAIGHVGNVGGTSDNIIGDNEVVGDVTWTLRAVSAYL